MDCVAEFYLNVSINLWDRKDVEVLGYSHTQADWVKLLNYDYLPHTQEDKEQLFNNAPQWEDEAYIPSVPFKVKIPFKRSPVPDKDFSYLDVNGNIKKMKIIDGRMYTQDGEYYGKLKNWDKYDIYKIE